MACLRRSATYFNHFCSSARNFRKRQRTLLKRVPAINLHRDMSVAFILPNQVPVCQLDCASAFKNLDQKEKKYAHYLSHGCNEGGLIVLLQTSPESPAIFMLLQKLFSEEDIKNLKSSAMDANKTITEDNFLSLLTYASGFYSNMGNYKSFGDTKIVPAISKEHLESVVMASEAYRKNPKFIKMLWNEVSGPIYNVDQRHRELGLGQKGISTYYSSNITEDDVSLVQKFMQDKNISPYNTRLFKTKTSNGGIKYELKLASAASSSKESDDDDIFDLLGKHLYEDTEIHISRGDYASILKRVNDNLLKAKGYAANENEMKMIENYIKSFQYGSINAHKDGSRYWIKNKGPIVESYIGFIESYRDPYGVRGEFEGFVSMVNKEMSKKFGVLVDKAEELLKLLPWPSDYEKDNFLRPDFTSLDVLTFAGSGIPAGINIPNYDDIRQDEGFKNVSLGNVLQAHTTDQKVTFLSENDQGIYAKLKGPSFEVQVGLHELLGHGSGKLFQQREDGSFNFDVNSVIDLETNEKIKSWYKSGETWDTKFSSSASSYEECRAECVGLHLCLDRDILRIFGHDGTQAADILYINWLNMVRAGLLGLEFYSPETKSWKQAHMNARFVILQVLLEAGDDLVTIKEITGDDGRADLLISIDRNKIETTGKKAIAHFLMRLQLYKATADVEKGQSMYQGYSTVNVDMLKKRDIVLARKQPRRMFVQSNTKINGVGTVDLLEYKGDTSGLIQSFVDRYPKCDSHLEELWKNEQKYHLY